MSRISTADKLARLISIVSWIADHDAPEIADVCHRFGISEADLVAQLDMAAMVGAESSEYTDMPIEVSYEGGRVQVFLFAFHRPLPLTPEQGLALVAAGTALRAVDGADPEGPLARALEKLSSVLGIDTAGSLDVDLGRADTALLDQLRGAAQDHRRVELDYWSAGRDDRTHRMVDPWRVFNDSGAWYLQAHCHLVGGERMFRVDRIRGAHVLDVGFDLPASLPDAVAYRAQEDDPRVTVDLDGDASWVTTAFPVDRVAELDDGRLRVTMPVGAPAWLTRLLLRLGPAARVVEIDDRAGGPSLARDTARTILSRYARDAPG